MYAQPDAEQAVISLLLMQPELYYATGLQAAEFTNTTCARLYTRIGQMVEAGQAVDLITVASGIEGINREFLMSCTTDQVLPEALPQYVDAVRRARVRNDLEKAAIQIQLVARSDEGAPISELVQAAQAKLDAIHGAGGAAVVTMREAVDEWLPTMTGFMDNPRETWGMSTGLDIDEVTGGLVDGEMTLVLGKPGGGKSAIAMQTAVAVALRHDLPALIFSMEMSRKQYMTRLACGVAGVDATALKLGKIKRGSAEAADLFEAAERLKAAPLFVVDELQSVATLEQTLYRYKREYGVAFVVVDYLDMFMDVRKTELERVPFISRSIKRTARQLDLPIWLLHAVSRAPEMSAQSAKYGGDFDADVVMLVGFDPYRTDDTAEIAIAKNRNGATKRVPMLFNGATTTWRNPARKA